MYKLCIYIPATHIDIVKEAIFEAGAGKIGNYDCCSWQTLGEGQFRPNDNANPFIGTANKIETVEEYKLETVVAKDKIKQVIAALKQAHPYEEVAYDVFELYSEYYSD